MGYFVIAKRNFILLMLFSVVVLTSGCATRFHDVQKQRVADALSDGIPVSEALDKMRIKRYQCREGSIFDIQTKNTYYECIRQNGHFRPWYGCTDRVRFESDSQNNVTNITVDYPACTEETWW